MRVAINYDSYGKDHGSQWVFNNGFTNVDCSPRDLAVAVYRGRSFCAQHAHEHQELPSGKQSSFRNGLNYLPTGFLALDFDGGRQADSIDELLRDYFIGKHACLLYSTSSSRYDAPRTRVIFEIDPIDTLSGYRTLQAALVHGYMASDQSCSDAMKAYSGSPNCDIHLQEDGRKIPASVVANMLRGEQEQIRRVQEARKRLLDESGLSNAAGKVREALSFIGDELDYGDWLKIVLCVWCIDSSETGIAMLEEWRPAEKNEVRNKFRHLERSGGSRVIEQDYLFRVAYHRGWRDPEYEAKQRERPLIDMMLDRRW
jgi:hypothetical protein